MSAAPIPYDQVRASVHVAVPPERAFRVFVDDIDLWWRHGLKYRVAGPRQSVVHLEPGVGGRLFERFEDGGGERVVTTGHITAWEPPERLLLEWRAVNFAPGERTEIEVRFAPARDGTLVTLTHRGFAALRPDHPVRHGQPPGAFISAMAMWWGGQLSSLRLIGAAPDEPAAD